MRVNYWVTVIQHLKPKFHNCLVISAFMFFVSIMQAAYLVIMKYWNVLSNSHPLFLNESIKPLLLSINYRTTGHFSLLFLREVSFFSSLSSSSWASCSSETFLFRVAGLGWIHLLSFHCSGRKQEVYRPILGAEVLLPYWCSDCCWHWYSWCGLLTELAGATEKDGEQVQMAWVSFLPQRAKILPWLLIFSCFPTGSSV